VNYDPLSGSNAWSVITFQGANGGAGGTENRIWDNSFEYRVNVGPVRFAVETQLSNQGNTGTGNAFQGNVGVDYMGFSFDVVGGKIYDGVSIALPLSNAQMVTLATMNINQGLGATSATISDNTVFQAAARYTIGPVKLFAGYEWIQYANPSHALAPGAFIEGGYTVAFANNTNFTTDKTLQTVWVGARYAVTRDVDLTLAYYHESQNSFIVGNGTNPTGSCTTAISSGCSGQLDAVSFVADWRFARHMDVFAGVMWSQVANGLANGYVLVPAGSTVNKTSNFDPGVGLRYQF